MAFSTSDLVLWVDMNVSEVMRPFVEQVWDDRERLVQRVAATVTTGLSTYRESPSSEVWIGMTRILERSVLGDPFGLPTDADRAAAYGTGVQGGDAGISAEDLVAAVLIGAREVEAAVMDCARDAGVGADVLFDAALASRRWAEQIAVWAAEGLGRANRRRSGDERAVAALVRAVRERRDAAFVREAGDKAGVDVTAARYVLVARGLSAGHGVDTATLRFTHSGEALWVDEPGQLVGLVDGRPSPVGGLVIGVAGPASLLDLSDALRDAERACRVASRFVGPGVHTLDDLGLLVALHEDPLLVERLRRRWVLPLLDDNRHDLAGTVRAWQECCGSVDEAARSLQVHPNTVRNRLVRIDGVLGRRWRAPQAQAEMWAALAVTGREAQSARSGSVVISTVAQTS